jgi:alkylation response protein AidB-like acyl-CoA dehydrogenase
MSEELREVVRSVLTRHSDEAQVWARLCEQVGAAGLAIPEKYGGAGASLAETHVVLEELGRTLLRHPLLSCAVAAEALLRSGAEDACARLLPRLAQGAVMAVAMEPYVLDAQIAETVLMVRDGVLWEVTEAVVKPCEPMDLTRRLATVEVRAAEPIGPVDAERLRDVACVAVSAEQVGTAARALELTVGYTKTRVQFGQPIAAFQAIQHRLADLHVLVESARAVSYAAVSGRTHPSVAKVYCSEVLMDVAAEMIQLHGGIGITWEHDAHRYFKRAHSAWHLFGAPREHMSRLASVCLVTHDDYPN